jgi:hypothetical protein
MKLTIVQVVVREKKVCMFGGVETVEYNSVRFVLKQSTLYQQLLLRQRVKTAGNIYHM